MEEYVKICRVANRLTRLNDQICLVYVSSNQVSILVSVPVSVGYRNMNGDSRRR